MEKIFDAIVIGAGIIGCCTAFELSKKGYRTVNINFQAAAGAGSTSNSCGNVRFYYSTRVGVALAYESYWYWHNWNEYIETTDERGHAKFCNTDSIFIKSKAMNWKKVKKNFDAVGVKYEEWDRSTLQKKVPFSDFHSYYPAKRPDDLDFYKDRNDLLDGACYTPESGYVPEPMLATQNVEAAVKAKGASFIYRRRVIEILQDQDRVAGVTLDDGTLINSPIIINASGPHSFKVTELAGQTQNNAIQTKALRHEVHVVPSPAGFKIEEDGYHTNDADIGAYYRPESGQMILTSSVDPECDPQEFVDPDNFDRDVSHEQWKAQVYRLARRIP